MYLVTVFFSLIGPERLLDPGAPRFPLPWAWYLSQRFLPYAIWATSGNGKRSNSSYPGPWVSARRWNTRSFNPSSWRWRSTARTVGTSSTPNYGRPSSRPALREKGDSPCKDCLELTFKISPRYQWCLCTQNEDDHRSHWERIGQCFVPVRKKALEKWPDGLDDLERESNISE
jgi:hypothetical protein